MNITNAIGSLFLSNALRNFYEPVILRPSEEQIRNATLEITFGSIESPINSNCPISLEQFNSTTNVMQIRHCGHIFNPTELNVWFQSNVNCPMCRYDIRRYRINNVAETEPNEHEENISNLHTNQNDESIFDPSNNENSNNIEREALSGLLSSQTTRRLLNNSGFDLSGNSILLFETFLTPSRR